MVLVDGSNGNSHDGSNLCLEIAPKARFKQIKSTHSLLIALSPNEYRIFKTIASVNFLIIESANWKIFHEITTSVLQLKSAANSEYLAKFPVELPFEHLEPHPTLNHYYLGNTTGTTAASCQNLNWIVSTHCRRC